MRYVFDHDFHIHTCLTGGKANTPEVIFNYAKENGGEALHKMLLEIDPESADKIHPNNQKRVIRALEIYKCTGKTKTQLDSESKLKKPPYESCVFFLEPRCPGR